MANTLQTIRRNFGRELGGFLTSYTTSGTTTTLVDTTFNLKSSISSEKTYKDWWVLRPNAADTGDKVRRVASYAPSSGTLTVDLAYTNAPTVELYELYAMAEPSVDMPLWINHALQKCFVVVELTLSPTANAIRHSLASAASWLQEAGWVRQVGYLANGENREQRDPYERVVRGHVVQDGGTFYLYHPSTTFNSTDTLYVKAIKPAYYHCRASGGSFGDQSGLTAETDEAPTNYPWVTSAALMEAWRHLGRILDPAASEGLIRDRGEAAAWFTSQTRSNFRIPELTFRPHRGWFGPLPGPGNLY